MNQVKTKTGEPNFSLKISHRRRCHRAMNPDQSVVAFCVVKVERKTPRARISQIRKKEKRKIQSPSFNRKGEGKNESEERPP